MSDKTLNSDNIREGITQRSVKMRRFDDETNQYVELLPKTSSSYVEMRDGRTVQNSFDEVQSGLNNIRNTIDGSSSKINKKIDRLYKRSWKNKKKMLDRSIKKKRW